MFDLDKSASTWLTVYFPVSWLTQFGHGLVTTVLGPTQPYLARNTGVSIDTVNFVWTFGFLGYLFGSLVTGVVFKRYLQSSRSKLIFLFLTICSTGIFMTVLPFTSSFGLLVTGRLVQNFALGSFITADASLIVFLIGPEKSRPFTMIIHAVIGAGFFVSTFLVRPFLPEEKEADQRFICNRMSNKSSSIEKENEDDIDVSSISWPFIITGLWCIVFSFGFLILAFLPYRMPDYYTEHRKEEQDKEGAETSIGQLPIFFILVFIYYFISCGIERIYQPMISTFGICGPLHLSPGEAVVTDSFYNGGFMCGRLASAVIAKLIVPRNIIIISLLCCLIASISLSVLASSSLYGLYAGTAILGCFVSWQFGACYSWVAKKVDVTGRISALFFIACGTGSLVTPPLAGYIFTSRLGPMSIIYLTLGFCILQCVVFTSMWMLARRTRSSKESFNLQQLKQ